MFWAGAVMFSPMMFDSPGSTNNRSTIFMLLAVYFFPVLLFGIFRYFSPTFLTISVDKVLIAFAIISILLSIFMGVPKLLVNSYQGISSTGYTVKTNGVYYSGSKIADANPATFEKIGTGNLDLYSRDQDHVFYRGITLKGADPKTFAPVVFNNKDTSFWKDQNQVYFDGEILENSNAPGFSVLGDNYAKNSTTVYYRAKALAGADVKSFILLEAGLAKDKTSLFLYGNALNLGADIATLSIYPYDSASGIGFIRDNKRAYILTMNPPRVIPGADPASLKILERFYIKDKDHVYFYNRSEISKIAGADAATFEVLPHYDEARKAEAKDNSRYYLEGVPVN